MEEKKESKLLSLRIKCSCGHVTTFIKEKISFGGSEDDCGICGSHGKIWLSFTCPICDRWQQLELESW